MYGQPPQQYPQPYPQQYPQPYPQQPYPQQQYMPQNYPPPMQPQYHHGYNQPQQQPGGGMGKMACLAALTACCTACLCSCLGAGGGGHGAHGYSENGMDADTEVHYVTEIIRLPPRSHSAPVLSTAIQASAKSEVEGTKKRNKFEQLSPELVEKCNKIDSTAER